MDRPDNLAGGGGTPHDKSMDARVAVLEEIAASTKQMLVEIRADNNRRFEDVSRRFEEVNRRFEEVNRRFDGMRDAMERDFRLLFGVTISTTLGLAALMARGFHWF